MSSNSNSSSRRKREQVITLLMNRASINPSPKSVKPVVQLATASKALRFEMDSMLPKKTLRKVYWEDIVDKILKKAKYMDRVVASPIVYIDDNRVHIDLSEMNILARATTDDFTDAVSFVVKWDRGKIKYINPIVPFSFDDFVSIKSMMELLPGRRYNWDGIHLLNFIAALVFGLSKADYLKKNISSNPDGIEASFKRTGPMTQKEFDTDDEDEILEKAQESIVKDCNDIQKKMTAEEKIQLKSTVVDMLLAMPDPVASDVVNRLSKVMNIQKQPRRSKNSSSS